jgi:hypothetical protein
LLLVPMRCRHCYHKFWVHRLFVLGQVIEAPAKPQTSAPREKSSVAARYVAQQGESDTGPNTRRRAG